MTRVRAESDLRRACKKLERSLLFLEWVCKIVHGERQSPYMPEVVPCMLLCLTYMLLLKHELAPMLAGDKIKQISLVGIIALLIGGPRLRSKIAGCNNRISFYTQSDIQPGYEGCY